MDESPEKKNQERSSWLFKQSSELEILISAAIIFAALQISDVISTGVVSLINANFSTYSYSLAVLAIVGLFMSTLLPISIVVHFVLRIFWLSLVGLHSAFPSEDKVEGQYNGRFEKIINNSLDLGRQVRRLDKLSSSIFAFSFLTLFSFCFPFISLSALLYLIKLLGTLPGMTNMFGEVLTQMLSFLVMGVFALYMMDFLTGGGLKRIKAEWFQKIYFPVYKFVGFAILAPVYRGIYYKLSKNVSKKVVVFTIAGYLIVGMFLLNMGYYPHQLYPIYRLDPLLKGAIINNSNYADQIEEDVALINPFIDSFVAGKDKGHIALSFPINQFLEDSLLSQCKDVVPFNTSSIHWRRWFRLGNLNRIQYDSTFSTGDNARNILSCFNEKMNIQIDDSLYREVQFYFGIHQNPDRHILRGYLSIRHLESGDHLIKISSKELYGKYTVYIPFLKD